LREKGGKAHAMPCHHNLETYLKAYIEGAGLADDPKGTLFRTIGRGTGLLSRTPLPQANAYAMIGRRAAAAGIATKLGNHSFRATGITAYVGRLAIVIKISEWSQTRQAVCAFRQTKCDGFSPWRRRGGLQSEVTLRGPVRQQL
jgi:hypothetical protein